MFQLSPPSNVVTVRVNYYQSPVPYRAQKTVLYCICDVAQSALPLACREGSFAAATTLKSGKLVSIRNIRFAQNLRIGVCLGADFIVCAKSSRALQL